MKNKTVVGIVLIILLLSIIAFIALPGYIKPSGLEVVDIKVKEPEPSLLNSRHITIDSGESVILGVTVRNKGDNITHRDAYSVGIEVIDPDKGDEYWQLPSEQLIRIDLSPEGESSHTFKMSNKKVVSGKFKIQAYIKSAKSGEQIARSDKVTIEIKYPA